MKRNVVFLLLALIVALIPATALAAEALSPQALEIANSLNCPICEGQSVRDSNSQLAKQMRQVIQEKVAAGEPRDQIIKYFTDRYGIGILRDPPKSGFILTLWWLPAVAVVVGALVLGSFIMQKRGRTRAVASGSAGTASSPAMEADLQWHQERFLKDLENSDMRTP